MPITLLLTAAASLAMSPGQGHDHAPKLGELSFQTSCNPAAQQHFEHGLGWLHSFEYAEAERTFAEAAAADPRCGIAYWGVAMTQYHPLWAAPTATELEKGRSALTKAKAAGGGSERERDYIAALDAFYRDSDRVDHKTRVFAHLAAMEQLHRRYPADREAAVFHALALIAAGLQDNDPEFQQEKKAGAILNEVLALEPDHPGVAHYLIHSFDYPPLAEIALPAAQRYAGIAPDSAHAQHMPSHIFTRRGLWEEAIKSNLKSEAASRDYAQRKGLAGSWDQRLHAMDYLAYAYLQTGQDREADRILEDLNAIQRVDPPVFTVAYAATAIPARLLLERRQWLEAAGLQLRENVRRLAPLDSYKWGQAHIHFARAVGAARSGKTALAREEVAKLKEIEESLTVPPGEYDWRKQVSIQRQVAEAWLAYAEGRKEESARLMRAAADLDDATEKHPVTPGAILPAREQLGELLLELGRPEMALLEYEASLKRAPRRLAGLYGAARAARSAGDQTKAQRYFAEIAELTKDSDGSRSEISEARRLAKQAAIR